MNDSEINVGVFVAHSPAAGLDDLKEFSRRTVRDVTEELANATGMQWKFHIEEPSRLSDDSSRGSSGFLDEASLRMVEGPFDVIVVITDVALISRAWHVVAGLASPVSRVIVISTRKFLITPRDKPVRTLDAESVRWNAATLLLQLIGHLLGLGHNPKEGFVMSEFSFDESRRRIPRFGADERRRLKYLVKDAPETQLNGGGRIRVLWFHLISAGRNLGLIFSALWRNRAPLLPLSLPRLATAAVAPTIILIFSAEIWDVGLGMTITATTVFCVLSLIAAILYLTNVHNLFYPRKEKRIITEHMAVVNVVIFLTVSLGILGLFVMVGLLMLFIDIYIFPPELMNTWTTLDHPVIDFWDRVQLAVFISTVGVLTGALAGGLENRSVVRHLALFMDEP